MANEYNSCMYIKEFNAWNTVKQKINSRENTITIRAGEIRWVVVGVNVGSEIDGKGDSFVRPGLVIKVIGKSSALFVPLSTKIKNVPGYIPFEWKGKMVSLCMHQIRTVSQQRILGRMGKISQKRLKEFKNEIASFFDIQPICRSLTTSI
ncbi:MAG: toxin-antitoxin protein [Candidatus Nomurabacteria bacterium]|nr:toxin-antitoxin protein [Candidatus Nomurabacteria bacterium]